MGGDRSVKPVMFNSNIRQQLGLPIGRLRAHGRLFIARALLAPAKNLAAGGLKEPDRLTQTSIHNSLQDIDDPLQGSTVGHMLDG